MKIGVYFVEGAGRSEALSGRFIVETFFLLAFQHPADSFFLFTRKELSLESDIPPNVETINLKSKAGLWTELRLRLELQRILKKVKADLLVLINNDRLYSPSVPHCLILGDSKKITNRNLKEMAATIVFNKEERELLARKNTLSSERIHLVYPGASDEFAPMNLNERHAIKTRHSDGMEYFLYNSNFDKDDDLVNLLKSFSQFKKRQQSSFKLLITAASNSGFEKKIADYKYRDDVKFVDVGDNKITAAAYAVVLPFNTKHDIMAALNAMRSGVPVIAPKNSTVHEISGDAILMSETNSIKDIADRMMQIYTDEDYRSMVIREGKAIAQVYTQERTARDIWQVILKALS